MFEELLTHHPPAGRGRLSFTAAIALHAAAAVAIVGAAIWSVGETPEPELPISWIVTLPPGPPAGDENAAPPRRAGRTRALRARTAPMELPAAPANAAVPETDPGFPSPPGEVETGDLAASGEPGSADGVPGGTGEPGAAGGPQTGEILEPGGDVRSPILVSREEPVYPEAARRARLEGEVILEAIITVSGDVEDVRVVKSAGPLLDPAAREAVGRWRYRAATLNGRAVRVRLTVVVSFRLH